MYTLEPVHPEWLPLVESALKKMDSNYLRTLKSSQDWLPTLDKTFNAFSRPLSDTKVILFGESPYPRVQSANGYAFWDNAVTDIWSPSGLSKTVNRATSLRNMIKMLLLAEGLLQANNLTQSAIADLSKHHLVKTLPQFFDQMMGKGFLLLNASLVLGHLTVKEHAKAWLPFMANILEQCQQYAPDITLLLFGKIALEINQIPAARHFKQLTAVHPYNISFITDPAILTFFQPFHLLRAPDCHA